MMNKYGHFVVTMRIVKVHQLPVQKLEFPRMVSRVMLRIPPLSRLTAFVLLSQSFTSLLLADVIVLKTGERLEATILRTTDTAVEAEVKMSASITDLKVFQKTDIASIEAPDPAEVAFASVKNEAPGPNSLTVPQYDRVIYLVLHPFVAKFPASPRSAQAKDFIAGLEEEKKRVAKGEIKIENIWYTPVELEKYKDQVNATLLLQKMKSLGQAGDNLAALNAFNQLEKNFPGARAYPAAVDYAMQLIPAVQTEVNTKKAILANDLLERKKGLEVLPDFRKAPLIAAAADEEHRANAALEAQVKAGIKWTSIYPRNVKSIEELQKTVTAEATRLAAIQTAPIYASLAAVDEARKQTAAGNLDGATASLAKASTLWAANLLLKDATAALAAAKITPTPTPVETPTPQKKPGKK